MQSSNNPSGYAGVGVGQASFHERWSSSLIRRLLCRWKVVRRELLSAKTDDSSESNWGCLQLSVLTDEAANLKGMDEPGIPKQKLMKRIASNRGNLLTAMIRLN
ncbi:unnamed protein product [Clavelina lepadiformis]|uniref:Uncharacterized protein n=1 Tax=Clavelina lepadiformis TaxID=159417 RepID=A0ABP0G8L5_CLALP